LPRQPLALILLGGLSALSWWQIRILGDVRERLQVFYGWFTAAFLLYLVTLWIVRRADQGTCPAHRPWWSFGMLLLWAVVFRALLLATTPTLSEDIYRYRWDGRVQQAGLDPYAHPPNAEALRFLRNEHFSRISFPHLRTIYPPLTEAAFRLGAWFAPTLTAQKVVFLLAELVTCASLVAILLARGLSPLWVVAYAWHPLVVLEFAGSGHNDALGIAFLWLGLAAWQGKQWLPCSLAWSAALLSKYFSVILVPWWWFCQRQRRWLAVFVVTAAVPIAWHPTLVSAFFDTLSQMTTRVEFNASVSPLLTMMLGGASRSHLMSLGLWAVFLLWWARQAADPLRYLFGGVLVAVLLSPAVHPWYLTWLIPFCCFWRLPAVIALTGSVVLAYTAWPAYLAGGEWTIPLWARVAEYVPVLLLGVWQLRRSVDAPRASAGLAPDVATARDPAELVGVPR